MVLLLLKPQKQRQQYMGVADGAFRNKIDNAGVDGLLRPEGLIRKQNQRDVRMAFLKMLPQGQAAGSAESIIDKSAMERNIRVFFEEGLFIKTNMRRIFGQETF